MPDFKAKTISLTPETWAQIAELAEGICSEAEQLRTCLDRGITAIKSDRIVHIDTDNKRLVQRKLKQRQERVMTALSQLAEITTEAAAQDLLAELTKYLSD